MTIPNAAPTSPRPTITRTSAGQPPRATNGASQALPPASARQRFCCSESAWRQTSAAPAQAKATGQNSCELMPRPVFCMIHNKPTPRAISASSMPQSMRRLGLLSSRNPARLADSSPGAFTVDSGGSNSHKAPYAITPMNWKVAKATNAILTTINGQPRCRASPVQTPPSHAPSATLVARGLSSESAGLESGTSSFAIGDAAVAGAKSVLAAGDSDTVTKRARVLCRPRLGAAKVRLEMARVRGGHDLLPSHAYWCTASRCVPDFSLSRTNSDVAAARTVPCSRQQPGALGVVPDSSRVARSAGWSA